MLSRDLKLECRCSRTWSVRARLPSTRIWWIVSVSIVGYIRAARESVLLYSEFRGGCMGLYLGGCLCSELWKKGLFKGLRLGSEENKGFLFEY